MALRPAYLTTAQAKEWLQIDHSDSDTLIGDLAEAASRAVDRAAGRPFGQEDAVSTRRYTAGWDRHRCQWRVVTADISTTTGLVVTCSAGTITDYVLLPVNAGVDGRPWEAIAVLASSAVQPSSLADDVTVVARCGWTAVPAAAETATRVQLARWWSRQWSPYGVAGSPDQGSELRLLARLDPDVATMLGPVRRWTGTVAA